MSVAPLDDREALARLDPGGMLGAIATIPDQLRDAWARTRAVGLGRAHRATRSVAVLGMGGSAIGADLVRGAFDDRLRVPLVSVRDYVLPAWVGPETLVIASSHSGATEETIAALETALGRRCPVVIVTSGGPLLEVARRAELAHVTLPGGGQPRAAVGYSLGLLAGVLEQAGHLDLTEREIEGAALAAQLAVEAGGPDRPTDANAAKRLAWMLVDRLPIVVGSGALAPVARRWKTQFNENGKSAAVAEELPEAMHNTVVGFAHPEWQAERVFVVFLRGPADHARNGLRAELAGELLDAARVGHEVVATTGEGRLAQALNGLATGDLVSAYLGLLYGVDPTPVEVLSGVKARLAAATLDDADASSRGAG